MPEQKVTKGVILPNTASIKLAVKQIQDQAKKNPEIAQALNKDPRKFLGERGFPLDVQRELLTESGKAAVAKRMGCMFTCWCSNCCFTSCGQTVVITPLPI